MNQFRSPGVWGGLVGLLLLASSPALAANRFTIEDTTLLTGSTGNVIPILADMDEDVYAFSVHVEYDPDKVTVTGVELGSDVAALAPEFSDGIIGINASNSGFVAWGVLVDLSDPITEKIGSGAGLEVLRLIVDVDATTTTTVELDLRDDTSQRPQRLNVMSDTDGNAIAPAPELVDGTITLDDLKPIIDSIVPSSGEPEDFITISGANFDQADLIVTVGGREAEFIVAGNGDLTVTVPPCATPDGTGPVDVEVCTVRGCDTDDNGFNYTSCGPVPPFIEGIVNNTGAAGQLFFVTGKNFDEPGLLVRVCGVEATFNFAPPDTISVTAPECPTVSDAWAEIEVCTEIGCDSRTEGFFYEAQGTPFKRGDVNLDGGLDISDPIALLNELFVGVPAPAPCRDARDFNDDGSVNISDPVYGLGFLFGGGDPIPPPFDDPGLDPTPDDLADC